MSGDSGLKEGQNFGDCVLSETWIFSLAAAAISIPLANHHKSYKPLVAGIGIGTGFDFLNGYRICSKRFEVPDKLPPPVKILSSAEFTNQEGKLE